MYKVKNNELRVQHPDVMLYVAVYICISDLTYIFNHIRLKLNFHNRAFTICWKNTINVHKTKEKGKQNEKENGRFNLSG